MGLAPVIWFRLLAYRYTLWVAAVTLYAIALSKVV
jgi:hypothetical protein